jgi:diguanylate cyclase (GGDEF)-like protein
MSDERRSASPLTGLPGRFALEHHVIEALAAGEARVVVSADLNHFKPFNDVYGYEAGDRVLCMAADLLREIVPGSAGEAAALAHLGGDDFLFLVDAARVQEVSEALIRAFDLRIQAFYRDEDLARGALVAADRSGSERAFPLITLSLAGVDLRRDAYERAFQVLDACAQVMRIAKARPHSGFFMDRRGRGVGNDGAERRR